jgi:hypothetical protein
MEQRGRGESGRQRNQPAQYQERHGGLSAAPFAAHPMRNESGGPQSGHQTENGEYLGDQSASQSMNRERQDQS